MKLPTKAAIIGYLGDLSALLVPLAALPYTLGEIADIMPPKVKLAVTLIAAFAAAGLKLIQRIVERHQGNADAAGIETAITVAKEAAGVPTPVEGIKEFVREAVIDKWACNKAPAGWRCTRKIGHDGPCAAIAVGDVSESTLKNQVPLVLLCFFALGFSGCAGSGPNGAWTPADTSAAFGAVNQGLQSYDRIANPAYYRPAGTTVIVP